MDDPSLETEVAESDALAGLVRRGLFWSFFNTAAGRTANFALGVILARLLVPDDYGIYAVAIVATQLLLSLNDGGVSSALIRWEGELSDIARTGATVVLGASVALYTAFFFLAPVVARLLNVPESTGVLRVLAISVLLDALFAVPSAALTRSFRQQHRMFSDMTSLVVSAVVSISLAVGGFGVWSLAWGLLAGNIACGIVIVIFSPLRVWPGWDPAIARELLKFGLPLTGSAFITFAILNTDYIVVGHVLGATALGFYYLAFNISSWPVNTISFSVRRVSLAGFSRLQHDANEMRETFLRSARMLATAAFPVCALVTALAVPLVAFVYGPKWAPAAAPLRWLPLLGAVRIVAELGHDYLVGAGRPRVTVVLQGAWFAVLVPGLVIGAHLNGIAGVGAGHALVGVFVLLPVLLWAIRRTGIRPFEVIRALAPGFAIAALAGIAAALGSHVLSSPFGRLLIGGVAGCAVAAGLVAMFRSRLFPKAVPATAADEDDMNATIGAASAGVVAKPGT